jgi:hypothetical protein
MTTLTPDDARIQVLRRIADGRTELTPAVVALIDRLPEAQRAAFTAAFTLSHAGRHHAAEDLDAFVSWEQGRS